MSQQKPMMDILKFADASGEFKRKDSVFRDFISSKPGSVFTPEKDRYHLYVSLACPWAHRTLIVRNLKGLGSFIDVSIVHWHMDLKGWRFINNEELEARKNDSDISSGTVDHLYNYERLSQLYFKAQSDYSGRYTVPILWDKKLQTIVNNESSEIIRMFNSEFNSLLPSEFAEIDLYPQELRPKIDELNTWIYDYINNGVYKSGFATKQEAYDNHVIALFQHLDKVENILKENHQKKIKDHFIIGNQLTEVDIRLFTTIVRFDPVYVQHFKCNIKMIRHDYPYLSKWLKLLYWKIPGFKETTDFQHIKFHYTKSHTEINRFGITPVGPVPDILPFENN